MIKVTNEKKLFDDYYSKYGLRTVMLSCPCCGSIIMEQDLVERMLMLQLIPLSERKNK